MAWVRLDDGFIDHPKVARLSDRALRVYLGALCYTSRFMTDGYVPATHFRGITPRIMGELTLEILTPCEEGFRIHDYLDYNLSREQWLELKEKRSKAGSKGGRARQAGRLASARANGVASA